MKQVRILLVIFLLGLTFFYNIERLDFGEENVIDIDSAVYVIGFVATVLTVSLSIIRYFNVAMLMALWAGVFIFSKMWLAYFADGRPILGGIYTYLSITELALLLIAVWISYKLAIALYDFELAVEKITLTDHSGRIQQFDEASEDVQVEMFRSRHNHHPLSVIIIEPEAGTVEMAVHKAVQDVQQAMIRRYVINNMAQTVSKYLRRTDVVLEQRGQGRFMVLCPETTIQDTKLLIEYIQTIISEQMGISVACGAATFPNEAFTFEEMVNQAEAHLNGSGNQHIEIESDRKELQ
jgi:GGDEF domain-containing protein